MLLLNTFKLREIKKPCCLIGPSIKQARSFFFHVDNTKISLRLPRHRCSLAYPTSRDPKKNYQIENYVLSNTMPSKDGWGSLVCISKAWDFYGPLLTGRAGTVTMTVTINSPQEVETNFSFFHPRAFEQSIADYLKFCYGEEVYPTGQKWLAPSHWKPLTKRESIFAQFQAVTRVKANFYDLYLVTPISDTRLLMINFSLNWDNVAIDNLNTGLPTNSNHDISNMQQLCEDIMNSLEVQLSDKALAQQREALTGLEDTSLVTEYPPLKWEQTKELV